MSVLRFSKIRSGDNSYEMSNMWQAGGDSQDQVPCGSNQTNCVVHPGGDHRRRRLLWGIATPRERWLATPDPQVSNFKSAVLCNANC